MATRFHSASEIAHDPELAKLMLARAEALLALEEQAALIKASKADLFSDMREEKLDPAFAKAYVAEKLLDPEKAEKSRLAAEDCRIVLDALHDAETRKSRARARAHVADAVPAAVAESISFGAHGPILISNSVDEATTDARPGYLPRAQNAGLPENGRNDPSAETAGITGGFVPVEEGPCVTTTGAREEAPTSYDPAPASDRPAHKDPLADPEHVVTPYFRKLICAEYGVDDDRFDDFRSGVIAGLSHRDAAARVSAPVGA